MWNTNYTIVGILLMKNPNNDSLFLTRLIFSNKKFFIETDFCFFSGGRAWRCSRRHPEEGEGVGAAARERARGANQLRAGEARARDQDHQPAGDGLAVRRRGASLQAEEGPQADEGAPQGCTADDREVQVGLVQQSRHEAIEKSSKLAMIIKPIHYLKP